MSIDLLPIRYLGCHNQKSGSNTGYTNPQHFLLNDGKEYLVKFKNNPQGTRVLVNDWVVGKLAQLLGLPVAAFELVYINKSHFKQFTELYEYGFKPGHQFASLLIKNCTGLWEPRRNGEIVNIDALPGIIVFDYWVNNKDRDTGNALLEMLPNEKCYLHLIDHGYCLPGYTWTIEKLKWISLELLEQDVHTWAATRIGDSNSLLQFTKKVMSLPEEQIYAVINSIPEDWDVTAAEKKALFKYFISARKVLPLLMVKFIGKYFSEGGKNESKE